MDKIKKVSSYLIFVYKCILVILPTLAVMQWGLLNWAFYKEKIFPGLELNNRINPGHLPLLQEYSFWGIAIGAIGSLIEILPVLAIFVILIKLFKNYHQGIIFSYQNSRKYNRMGWLLILDAVLAKPLGGVLVTLGGSFSNPPGQRFVMLSVGTPNLESLFFGIIIIFISWVMIEGSALQEEQKLTV